MRTDIQPAPPVLQVSDLGKTFHVSRGLFKSALEVHAVNGVSLEIAAGETLGIVGESGCGKSTLSRMLAGIIEPSAGSLRLAGRDVAALSGAARQEALRDVQMIFQSPYSSLNPRLRAVETVREPLDIHRKDLRRAERRAMAFAMLEQVGIGAELAERYPHEMSGGQQQRVGIARALVGDVSVVICDEPVSALDVSIQAQVINLLRALQHDRRVAYLFVSHDLAVVGAVSHQIGVMYLGRIVEIGQAADVLQRPRHPYTQSLIESANVPDPAVERARTPRVLEGELPRPTDPDIGCRFAGRCWRTAPVCREQRPPLATGGTGRQAVACHFPLEPSST